MRYFLDTNSLTSDVMALARHRKDIYVIQDVLDEFANSSAEVQRVRLSGIQIVDLSAKHLDKMKEVMLSHGDNFGLIDLSLGEGRADVAMIAYILSEKDSPDTLFGLGQEYVIITKDKPLTEVAKSYGINCIESLV
ncbi:MAG: hypothetical protein FGM57_02750 [Candidatus Taylorbacteria bacterium]|nr:hypothetical protein [Candidatus Taylorbacteria bacterium]